MRTVDEWIGKNDDQAIPKTVKDRILLRAKGKCATCGNIVITAHIDHKVAICNGGPNAEHNLQLLCVPCHKTKTKSDRSTQAKDRRVRAKHFGLTTPKQKIASRGFAKRPPQRTASRPIVRTPT